MSEKDLRAKLIRLAHQKPELRKHLLPLVTKTADALDNINEFVLRDTIGSWSDDGWYRYIYGDGILESYIEFVFYGNKNDSSKNDGIGSWGPGTKSLEFSENKKRAQKECEEHAKKTLEKPLNKLDLKVKSVKSRMTSFDYDFGTGRCELIIQCALK